MSTKTATIIDIKATDTTRHAQATRISWAQVTFIDTNRLLVVTDPRCKYEPHHELCFVSRTITSEQKGLNGIHHRELDGARYYKNVLDDVISRVEDDYIICHDAKRTKQLLSKAGVPADSFNFICVSSVAKKLYPKLGSYTIATLIYEFCENTAIDYIPHNWHGRYNATFLRHVFKQLSILNNLRTMQDWYELSDDRELAHG